MEAERSLWFCTGCERSAHQMRQHLCQGNEMYPCECPDTHLHTDGDERKLMEYKEIVVPGAVTVSGTATWKSSPTYAIDINDFDSMALRLVRQLTRKQIGELIQRAYEEDTWTSIE